MTALNAGLQDEDKAAWTSHAGGLCQGLVHAVHRDVVQGAKQKHAVHRFIGLGERLCAALAQLHPWEGRALSVSLGLNRVRFKPQDISTTLCEQTRVVAGAAAQVKDVQPLDLKEGADDLDVAHLAEVLAHVAPSKV